MCGRTCLTLDPDNIISACKYESANSCKAKPKDDTGKCSKIEPEWRSEYNCGRKYEPSYNIAPTDITPVIVSSQHFESKCTENSLGNSRLIVPMMWGMIPFWHKGDYKRHGLSTNNCRMEHMLDSKLYRGPFRKGQRCVVLCEGFYEWQTTKSAKPSERAAYMIYLPQIDDIKIYDKSTWNPENVNLMKLAGLFDVWEDENGDKMYSYSVITFESSEIMSWMHHRMPAILETNEQVNDWLDFKRVSDEQALATLKPASKLEWHQVTNLVNNSRHKSNQCNKPVGLCKIDKTPRNKIMESWLVLRKRREEDIAKNINNSDEDCNQTSESEIENSAKHTTKTSAMKLKKNKNGKRRKIDDYFPNT